MSAHPFRDVALVGVHNTAQARRLEGRDSLGVTVEAALGAVADAGLDVRQVDGVAGEHGRELIYQARLGPAWRSPSTLGIPAVLEAASAIACGLARVVVVCVGAAGVRVDDGATAAWTRPAHELVAPFGMFTAAEFALVARQHMERYGTTPEALATVAATIRNNGHVNPEAVYHGRGPFTPADVLASRMVADPFHLLDCATASEGGCAVVLARADIAAHLRWDPVFIAGGGTEAFGPSYEHAPTFGLGGARGADLVNGWVGRGAARRAFAAAGLGPDDVDVCELYDPFSFEVIRQLEAFGFCGEGEGGDLVLSGAIGPDGRWPTTTDGGTMSFGHAGAMQLLQRVARGVQQLRRACPTRQVAGAEVALCSGGGSGALFSDVLLLTRHRP